MNIVLHSILVIATLLITPELKSQSIKTYTVKKIDNPVQLTGRGTDVQWKKANVLSDFIYPWEKAEPPSTIFRSLHDKDWIYFFFDVDDENINVLVESNHKRESVRSDRVELFLRKDSTMSPYYCLEIDPLARVFDCKGEYYRKLDTEWSWPQGEIEIKSHRNMKGYTVELRISKMSLTQLGLLNGNQMEAGVFRADCYELTERDSKFRWISWIDPQSENPDFHIPQAFGQLVLEN